MIARLAPPLCLGLAACTAPPPEPAPLQLELPPDAFVGRIDEADVAPEAAQPSSTARTCPPGHVSSRLSSALAGLAWVSYEQDRANLYARTPAPGAELTVVRESGTLRTTTYKALAAGEGRSSLEIPLAPAAAPERLTFVTDACLALPDSARLRAWTAVPITSTPIDARVRLAEQVRPYLLAQLPAADRRALERFGKLRPAAVDELPSTLPGCPRVVVVANDMSRKLAHDFVSALLCIDAAGAITSAPIAPRRGPALSQLAVVDLDGDGVDELIASVRERVSEGMGPSHDELLWADPQAGELRRAPLGPP